MLWLLLYHLICKPCGSGTSTCDPQTPAGHGPVRPHTVTSVRGSDDMDAMVEYVRDSLEAKARKLMAEQHIVRGFDTARVRAEWLARVDDALDAYNESRVDLSPVSDPAQL